MTAARETGRFARDPSRARAHRPLCSRAALFRLPRVARRRAVTSDTTARDGRIERAPPAWVCGAF